SYRGSNRNVVFLIQVQLTKCDGRLGSQQAGFILTIKVEIRKDDAIASLHQCGIEDNSGLAMVLEVLHPVRHGARQGVRAPPRLCPCGLEYIAAIPTSRNQGRK